MSKRIDKLRNVIMDCYRELYKNSITYDNSHGDFDKIVEEAPIDKEGKKVIPYKNYYLNKNLYTDIVEKYKKSIRNKHDRVVFSTEMMLGCGPCTNREAWWYSREFPRRMC